MSNDLNPNYSASTTVGKAATEGGVVLGGAGLGVMLGVIIVNSLRNTGAAVWDPALDNLAVGIVAALCGAVAAAAKKAWRNIEKHKWLSMIAVMGLAVALSGCVATQGTDGTWTVQTDQSALDKYWDRYEALEARKRALNEEQKTASPPRLNAIVKELEAIAPEIKDLAQVLGVKLK